MPISWQLNEGWIDITFTDPYTAEESEAAMKAIFAEPGAPRPLRFLVDVRNSQAPNTEFVGNAILFWQLHIDKMWGARVAIVTGTAGQARMAHVSERTAESRELPFTLRVFDGAEEPEALQWLAAEGDGPESDSRR
jgi:hypothetical protein